MARSQGPAGCSSTAPTTKTEDAFKVSRELKQKEYTGQSRWTSTRNSLSPVSGTEGRKDDAISLALQLGCACVWGVGVAECSGAEETVMSRVGDTPSGGCTLSYVTASGQGQGSYLRHPLRCCSRALTTSQASDRLSTEGCKSSHSRNPHDNHCIK